MAMPSQRRENGILAGSANFQKQEACHPAAEGGDTAGSEARPIAAVGD